MSLNEIFSTVLLDHYHHPRQHGHLEHPDHTMEGANPLCGDEIVIEVKVDQETVQDIAFSGKACAICTASTSMFCEQAVGKKFSEIETVNVIMHRMIKGEELEREDRRLLGDAYALQGVSKLPVRVKCALLVYETWNVLLKQIKG